MQEEQRIKNDPADQHFSMLGQMVDKLTDGINELDVSSRLYCERCEYK